MDKDLKSIYGKLGKGKKLTEKEDAYMFGRKVLNNAIDDTINDIGPFTCSTVS